MEIGVPTEDGEAVFKTYQERLTTRDESFQPELKWFAAYTATHHEKRVMEQLAGRCVETYLPSYRADRHWRKRPAIKLDLPLFPNYVFVHMRNAQRSTVLGTPGVYSIVGADAKPWELPEWEIDALRTGLLERTALPHPYLAAGDRARIVSGLMAGLEGVIVRQKNNLRLVLSLDQIMQSIAIEVAPEELEPVPNSASQLVRTFSWSVRKAESAVWLAAD